VGASLQHLHRKLLFYPVAGKGVSTPAQEQNVRRGHNLAEFVINPSHQSPQFRILH
jgi:galactose-1-phosphate uridylyltransferase